MREQLLQEVLDGQVLPTYDPEYQRIKSLEKKTRNSLGLMVYGYRPGAPMFTLITYAFLHGGWLHLIGNLLFLYLCGCNMEDRWGPLLWVAFYLIGGIFSALTWRLFHPNTVQYLIGASGAIAAAMGAFLIVHYKAEIRIWYFIMFFLRPLWGEVTLKAFWALPLWLLAQLFWLGFEGPSSPIAHSAHVGGFLVGMVWAIAMKLAGVDERMKKLSDEKAVIFTQPALYLQGLEHLAAGDQQGAEQSFELLLQKDPDHLDSLLELWRLRTDPLILTELAKRIITTAKRRGDNTLPITLFTELGQRVPSALLDDKSLFIVAECYNHGSNLTKAMAVYARLLKMHPQSPLAPKAMLNSSEILLTKLNDKARAYKILTVMQARYAGSPFAERAAQMIADFQLTASPLTASTVDFPPGNDLDESTARTAQPKQPRM
jgi:membrane associated rhomboid family serine protease